VVASAFGDGVDGVLGVHFWFIGGVGGVYKSGVGVFHRPMQDPSSPLDVFYVGSVRREA